jgi:hypothetical protein
MTRLGLKSGVFAVTCHVLVTELVFRLLGRAVRGMVVAVREGQQRRLERRLTRKGLAEPEGRIFGEGEQPELTAGPPAKRTYMGPFGLFNLPNHWR